MNLHFPFFCKAIFPLNTATAPLLIVLRIAEEICMELSLLILFLEFVAVITVVASTRDGAVIRTTTVAMVRTRNLVRTRPAMSYSSLARVVSASVKTGSAMENAIAATARTNQVRRREIAHLSDIRPVACEWIF